MKITVVFFVLFFYALIFTLAGIMAYGRLEKEKIFSEEEKKRWKKYLIIMSVVTVVLFLTMLISENLIFIMPLPQPLPFYHDFPTHIRLAGNM